MVFVWDIAANLALDAILLLVTGPLGAATKAPKVIDAAQFVLSVVKLIADGSTTIEQGLYYSEFTITDYKKVLVNGVLIQESIDKSNRYHRAWSTVNGSYSEDLLFTIDPLLTDLEFIEYGIGRYHNDIHSPNHTYTNDCDTTCDVCGGGLRSVDHNYQWKYTATQHYQECTICHKQKDNDSHQMGSWKASYNDPMYCYRYCTDYCGYFEKKTHPGWVQKWAYYGQSCTNGGDWTKTCTDCYYVSSTYIAPGSSHTGGTATCTSKAICTRCGEGYGSYASHVGGTATCTTKKVCTRCDESYGQPLGHTPGGSTATCTSPQTCSRCGATLQSALGHTGGTATCTAAKICTRCDKSYGSSLGHTPGADATCTTAQTCKRCTYKYKNALGHSYGSWSSYDSSRHRRVCTRSGCNSYESGSHYLGSNGLTCGACGRRGPFSGVSRLQN